MWQVCLAHIDMPFKHPTLTGGVAELAASLLFVPAEVLRNRFMMGANPARATGGRVARPTNYASLGAAVRTIYSEKVCCCTASSQLQDGSS